MSKFFSRVTAWPFFLVTAWPLTNSAGSLILVYSLLL